MRVRAYWRAAARAAALTILWTALAPAGAQDYNQPPAGQQAAPGWSQPYGQAPGGVAQVSYPEAGAPAGAPAQPATNEELQRRLQALEAAYNADKADSGCKEVPLQTAPNLKFRGYMFFDNLNVEPTPLSGPLQNFTGFRDLRFGAEGNVYENLKMVLEVNFSSIRNLATPFNQAQLKDVYMEQSELPWVGRLRVGHFKEPDGLEQNTSDKFVTFMERAQSTTVFTPSRKDGLMIYDTVGDGEYFTWFAGVFRGETTDNDVGVLDSDNDVDFTTRVAWLPYYDEATPGRGLLHVGGAMRAARTGGVPGASGNGDMRPTFELDSYNTGLRAQLLAHEEFMQYGSELLWIRGPFSLQNEFFFLETGDASAVRTWGTYVEASYFLTGENRGYNKVNKTCDRVKPYENFFAVRTADGVCRGWGAWQLAGRWSYSDLETNGTLATAVLGTQSNFTLGVNWYLNPYSRVMLNYVHATSSPDGGAPDQVADDFGVRWQVDW